MRRPRRPVVQSITESGSDDLAVELRQVEDRHVQLAADDALGQGLPEIEVEVAERARRNETIGLGIYSIAEVAARRWRVS